ncbi:cytoplasmic chaperone TorD [Stappia sp. 22II-S9-Z10]|nr:cytoplasmic chaperone TorD [Stappia sp. 22II-S9-Z10]
MVEEHVSDIARRQAQPQGRTAVPAEDLVRADVYTLLANLLSRAPDRDTLAGLKGLSGDDSAIGKAVTALARVAAETTPGEASREYDALFIGLGRGELVPFASYYLTGFLNEKPLAVLRGHMRQLGIARAAETKDPEDHIASLCEMMAGLIRGDYASALSVADQDAFFNTHIATWAGHFFADLEGAAGSRLYAPIGTLGRAFMDIEIEAFRMASASSGTMTAGRTTQ